MKPNNEPKGFLDRIPSFSLVLIMVVFMVIGASLIPMLNFAYRPTPRESKHLSVYYSWPGASKEVIEKEITSLVEGAVSSVNGVKRTSSTSYPNSGQVDIDLKEGVKVSTVRFELSSVLKQLSDRLPKEMRNISISGGNQQSSKKNVMRLLTYTVNSDKDAASVRSYINETIKPALTKYSYVRKVDVGGYAMMYLDVSVNPEQLKHFGLSYNSVTTGIQDFLGHSELVGSVEHITPSGETERITLHLETEKNQSDIGKAPVGVVEGRIITLDEVAELNYKKQSASSYNRVNGLNTTSLSISVDAGVNIINASAELREEMDYLISRLDTGYQMKLSSDEAEEVRLEIAKLLRRITMSLLILLFFVWLVSRSWSYVSIISITLLANVLMSVICYYLFHVELNLISLAGVAVSFGITIDTVIIMVDHYSYYRNRKAFLAILAALLTTIGSLVIIFFMPEYVRGTLNHFAVIIIINLSISLLIALFFVPALIERCHLKSKLIRKDLKHLHRVYHWEQFYMKYIHWIQRKRWVCILLLVLAFGIPIHLLPPKWENRYQKYRVKTEKVDPTWYQSLYNNTIGSDFYQHTLRKPLEMLTGGSLRLFSQMHSSRSYYHYERSKYLSISGKLSKGNNTEELNQKFILIEKFLSNYPEIKTFATRIWNTEGQIYVEFQKKLEDKDFPVKLEQTLIKKLLKIKGVDWETSGISPRGFATFDDVKRKEHRIGLEGYNYDELLQNTYKMAELVKKDKRAKDVSVELGKDFIGGETELYIDFDKEKMALLNLDLSACYSTLTEKMSESKVGNYYDGHHFFEIQCHSTERDEFDLWHLKNSYIPVGDQIVSFNRIAEIGKRKTESLISKSNQEYATMICFNFDGEPEECDAFIEKMSNEFNKRLPVGFHTGNKSLHWYRDTGSEYWLILIIVVIIFFICSILFESLWQPLVIISLIPISYIGTFLTFYFTGVNFGTGGFASLVLLSGLVVNAAIYIVNDYNGMDRKVVGGNPHKQVLQLYVKAFDHKIVSIFLTVLSTILGLVPFLIDGPEAEEFWFSFAVGTMGGLLFSLVSLSFCLPVLIPFNKIKRFQPELD